MKKKIIGIIAILVGLNILANFVNYLVSIGDTPDTSCYYQKDHKKLYYGLDGYPYSLPFYPLHDDSRACHFLTEQTFYIEKKVKEIARDDYCEHCYQKWSWHYKKFWD